VKVLVTGSNGQLGYDVVNELKKRNQNVIGVDVDDMDITNRSSVTTTITTFHPDAIIHCAAWTDVDGAEDEKNKRRVWEVNVIGTKNIAEACKCNGCKFMYISTDYVFNGQGSIPWAPECKEFNPRNFYGKSKLEGELLIENLLDNFFIIRIEWLFGINGINFISKMLKIGKSNDVVRVVNDQIGTPTYSIDLARLLVDFIFTEKYGYYHVTNEGGYISWYEFATEIFSQAYKMGYEEYNPERLKIIPVTTVDFGLLKAKRPFNSRFDKSKITQFGFTKLPVWKDALTRYLEAIDI